MCAKESYPLVDFIIKWTSLGFSAHLEDIYPLVSHPPGKIRFLHTLDAIKMQNDRPPEVFEIS